MSATATTLPRLLAIIALLALLIAPHVGCVEQDDRSPTPRLHDSPGADGEAGATGADDEADEVGPDPDRPNAPHYDTSQPASRVADLWIAAGPEQEDETRLGPVLESLATFMTESGINTHLQARMERGRGVPGFVWPTLGRTDTAAEGLTVHLVELTTADGMDFAVSSECLDDEAEPRYSMLGGVLHDGELAVGPGSFPITLAIGDAELALVVEAAWLTGRLSRDGDGVRIEDGEVVGAVPVEGVRSAIDRYLLSDACQCLGIEEGVYRGGYGSAAACFDTFEPSGCSGPGEQACVDLASSCRVLGPIFQAEADTDSDGDGILDAISARFGFEAVGVRLAGVR